MTTSICYRTIQHLQEMLLTLRMPAVYYRAVIIFNRCMQFVVMQHICWTTVSEDTTQIEHRQLEMNLLYVGQHIHYYINSQRLKGILV